MAKNIDPEELKELIGNIHTNNRTSLLLFSILLLFSLLLKWQEIEIPWIIIEIIALFLFINVLAEYLAEDVWSKQTASQANFGYFLIQLIEVLALFLGFYFLQTVFFGEITLLTIFIIFSFFAFTRRIYPQLIAFICVIGYIVLGLLTHFRILDYYSKYQNPPLFIANISWTIGFLICLAFYGDILSKKLRNAIENLKTKASQLSQRENLLIQKEKELEAFQDVWEKEIEARTKEIKNLTENLSQTEQKGKELQVRVEELERFYKLSIGRESKMIQLKQEIKKLKEELEKCQKRTEK